MKKVCIFGTALFLIMFIVSGAVLGAEWYREDRTTNVITIGSIDGSIVEEYEQGSVVMPGGTVRKVVRVKNDGDTEGFIRVRLEAVWTDSGETADKTQLRLSDSSEDWIIDENMGYLYYTKVLLPGESTTPVMTSFELDGPSVHNEFSGRPGSIYVYMEMVQAEANGLSLWGKEDLTPGEQTEQADILFSSAAPDDAKNAVTSVCFYGPDEGFVFYAENGDLFSDFKSILPGETRVQEITVLNQYGEKTEILFRAREYGGDVLKKTLVEELLKEHAVMTISDGKTEIYSGPVLSEDGFYGEGISLGMFDAGEEVKLQVSLHVGKEVDNDYQNLLGNTDWIFSARGTENEPVPQTGDGNTAVWQILLLTSGTGCTGFIVLNNVRRKRYEKCA